ncbi:MAG: BspA family leucine-rich repeat surface protein [Actinobacteria bacterium]|uniref:Unannotated protein n=1 Tax=freshwater metagenome TaxID=449393 RepID=A0A6J7K3B3_9ZZZZ|nr:BspA family leucine-rich repeat surface protein [Actinomycetota bacterium]
MTRALLRRLTATVAATALAAVGLAASVPPASATTCGSGAMVLEVVPAANETVELALFGTVTNITINWGDGTIDSGINASGLYSHTYGPLPQIFWISISGDKLGTFGYKDNRTRGADAITEVREWGNLGLEKLDSAFVGATHLTKVPNCLPTTVTSLYDTFDDAIAFNQDISSWNTHNVTDMQYTFMDNDNLGMTFNQPIGNWDTSNVTNMYDMFYGNKAFNQPIGSWNTSKVTDMGGMFYEATAFNQPLANWDTSAATDMFEMFRGATAFNQPIGNWNTSNVTRMYRMFSEATAFNQPIGNWNTSKVTNMGRMFKGASSFNQPIGNWDTSKVTGMYEAFSGASAFNRSLGNWNIGSVVQDWSWDGMSNMLDGSGLTVANYNATLSGWSGQTHNSGISLGASGLLYSASGQSARDVLIAAPSSWAIAGDSAASAPTISSVSVTGTAVVRGTLTAMPTGVTGRPTLSYSWQSSANGTSGWATISGASSSTYTIPDSQAGRFLRVGVTAANGISPSSSRTSANTASVARTTPTAPRTVTASPRNASAVVSWQAPASTGGAQITSYTVTATSPGRPTRTCSTKRSGSTAPARSCTVLNLVNSKKYSFTVRARTTQGTTVRASVASVVVSTIAGTPTQPRTVVVAFPASHTAQVTWDQPQYTGSGAVTGYRVRWYDTFTQTYTSWSNVSANTRTTSVGGRILNRHYIVYVQAHNVSGWGAVASKALTQTT